LNEEVRFVMVKKMIDINHALLCIARALEGTGTKSFRNKIASVNREILRLGRIKKKIRCKPQINCSDAFFDKSDIATRKLYISPDVYENVSETCSSTSSSECFESNESDDSSVASSQRLSNLDSCNFELSNHESNDPDIIERDDDTLSSNIVLEWDVLSDDSDQYDDEPLKMENICKDENWNHVNEIESVQSLDTFSSQAFTYKDALGLKNNGEKDEIIKQKVTAFQNIEPKKVSRSICDDKHKSLPIVEEFFEDYDANNYRDGYKMGRGGKESELFKGNRKKMSRK